MDTGKGFHTVLWLRGYRDGLANTWAKNIEHHEAYDVYRSGHLEGAKERIAKQAIKHPKPANAVARIKENNETFGG